MTKPEDLGHTPQDGNAYDVLGSVHRAFESAGPDDKRSAVARGIWPFIDQEGKAQAVKAGVQKTNPENIAQVSNAIGEEVLKGYTNPNDPARSAVILEQTKKRPNASGDGVSDWPLGS